RLYSSRRRCATHPSTPLFPYTTLFRSLRFIDWARPERNVYHVSDEFAVESAGATETRRPDLVLFVNGIPFTVIECKRPGNVGGEDRKSTRLNSSHVANSYAVFCLKKKR